MYVAWPMLKKASDSKKCGTQEMVVTVIVVIVIL